MLTFVSNYPSLRVQVRDELVGLNATGKYALIKSAAYAEFKNGEFPTSNLDTIEALLTHRSYNKMFYGPFSLDDVYSGAWKKLYEDMQAKQDGPADPTTAKTPALDKIKAQIAATAKANKPSIIEGVRTTADLSQDDRNVVVPSTPEK
jgi:hypothetical protein